MAAPSSKVFVKAATGNGYYTTRNAVLQSHYLQQLLVEAEASGNTASNQPVEITLPDFPADELIRAITHCEREHGVAVRGTPTREEVDAKDKQMLDGLEHDSLLRLVGVCHRLGISSLLNMSATRVAQLLAGASTPTGERAGVPFDVYIRRDPLDALSDDERERARDEFIFTLPDTADGAALPASTSSWSPLLFDRYTGAATYLTENASNVAAAAAGGHGTAGTGAAGMPIVTDTRNGVSARLGVHEGSEEILTLLGGEAPLLAVLLLLDAPALQNLKCLGRRWRRRCRTALCSGTWAERTRARKLIDLGVTRHWQPHERSAVAKFLSDGRCSRLERLRADGFEAELPPLLDREHVDSTVLLSALSVNPCSSGMNAETLCAQSEFCTLVALWLLGSSPDLRTADFSSLTYSGLLPLKDALPPAVELCARRSLSSLTIMKSALPVKDLIGLPQLSPSSRAASTLELKWKRLGALDATLIAALLKSNRTLTKLDLSWNSDLCAAGTSGATELAQAIAESRVLRDVDLSETSLGESCAASMLRAITHNATLTRLNLRSCVLTAATREALKEAAKRRPSSMELVLA